MSSDGTTPNAPAKLDPQQLHKMTEAMGADLRALKERLDRELAEKDALVKQREAEQKEMETLRSHMNQVKEEKKRHFAGMIQTDVKPFLENLRKNGENDERFTNSLDRFEENLNKGLNDAFMDQDSMATLQTIRAAASANQVTSSKLEELFQSQKQWEEKFGSLQKENEELLAKTAAAAEKEKMVEELKKELAELKAVQEKTVANVESHFEKPAAEAPVTQQQTQEQPQIVTATASSSDAYFNGFETLFDFKPRENWRSN